MPKTQTAGTEHNTSAPDKEAIDNLAFACERMRRELSKVIVGQEDVIEQLLTVLLARGHALLEGVPGLAKTLLISTLSQCMALNFRRVQFTPDLMPSDILGSEVLQDDPATGQRMFKFVHGPVFTNVLLADEINRTPPKTQAALLEAMQERAVTIDGERHALSPHFMVVATQNPIEHQGVYPLPEAQLDRFLFKLLVDYPDFAEEERITAVFGARTGMQKPADFDISAKVNEKTLNDAMAAVAKVRLVGDVISYIVRLVRATRETADLENGASPRASIMLASAARARAALSERDYVIPDDVKALASPVLRHRVTLSPAAEIEGKRVEAIVDALVGATEAPR